LVAQTPGSRWRWLPLANLHYGHDRCDVLSASTRQKEPFLGVSLLAGTLSCGTRFVFRNIRNQELLPEEPSSRHVPGWIDEWALSQARKGTRMPEARAQQSASIQSISDRGARPANPRSLNNASQANRVPRKEKARFERTGRIPWVRTNAKCHGGLSRWP